MDDETPNTLVRTLVIERDGDTAETGVFSAVLASEGEASDGHILSIDGMVVPESMPLLFRHTSSEVIPALGRVLKPKKVKIDGTKSLRVQPQIDMGSGGEKDTLAGVRRGIAHMVGSGTLDAMSVRWDEVPGQTIARRNLPSDHFAFVDLTKTPDHPGAFGAFFGESLAREGSIVAIGADPTALMGRSQETDDPLEQTFWAALARSVEENSDGMGEIVAGFEAIRLQVDNLRELGCSDADLVNAVGSLAGLTHNDLIPCHYGSGKTLYVPREAWIQLRAEKSSEFWAALSLAATPGPEAEAPDVREAVRKEPAKDTKPQPRILDALALRRVIKETASESITRKLNHALGRIGL